MAVQHVAKRKDGQTRQEAHPNDFYCTPIELVEAQFKLSYEIWRKNNPGKDHPMDLLDPCMGSGAYGVGIRNVIGGWPYFKGVDIAEYRPIYSSRRPVYDQVEYIDFLQYTPDLNEEYDMIVFNPPYSDERNQPLAHKFILKALDLVKPGGVVSALVKAEFWNGHQRFNELFSAGKRPVLIVPSVSRVSFDGTGKTSTQDYSIGIWVSEMDRVPEVRWIKWKDEVEIV